MPDDPFSPDQRGPLAAALEAMEGTTIYDTRGRTATIGLGEVDAAGVVDLLAAWAPIVFGHEPLTWSSSGEE